LRPVEIVVDNSSWIARGASNINSISVKAYPKGTPNFQRPNSGTTVGVLFYQDAGAISLNRAPNPLKSGTKFRLTSDESIVEAKSASSVDWVYEISINR